MEGGNSYELLAEKVRILSRMHDVTDCGLAMYTPRNTSVSCRSHPQLSVCTHPRISILYFPKLCYQNKKILYFETPNHTNVYSETSNHNSVINYVKQTM